MSWRLASRLSVVTLALLVVLVVAFFSLRNITNGQSLPGNPATNTDGSQGTDLGSVTAPDFRLTDQFGKQVSLSQFKGEPVVLTFLYTHCPNVCPLIAEQLHTVMLDLGKDAQHVAVLAVSVDPGRDTIAAAMNFSKAHNMTSYWHFLVGTEAQLSPVWTAYAIGAQQETATVSMHTAALYIIDKQGRERVLLDQTFTLTYLTGLLQTLLKE
jgi:protein SCO1/2